MAATKIRTTSRIKAVRTVTGTSDGLVSPLVPYGGVESRRCGSMVFLLVASIEMVTESYRFMEMAVPSLVRLSMTDA